MNFKVMVATSVLLMTSAADARTVLAVCGEPKGKIHSVNPRRGWDNVRSSGTSLSFVQDAAGRVDVLTTRTQRGMSSLRGDGAEVRLTHHSRDFSYFIITVVRQRAQVDTYQVTFGPDGKGRLLWSSLKSHIPPYDATTGWLLAADCIR